MLSNILLPTALLLSSVSASCLHGTSLLPRRLSKRADEVEVTNFGYTGLTGPLNWHNIEPENDLCNTGTNQSPINIDDTIPLATEAPTIDIAAVDAAEFENIGTTLETVVNGTTTIAGQDFSLAQYHLHTPSEHRIGEEYFPLEMHMVHEAADGSGKVVVLAVLFQLDEQGATTELLTATTENIDDVANPGSVTETGALDFAALVDHLTTTPLFNYTGSLTTPPCTEDVTFLVTQHPLPIDVATYNKVKSVIKFNSRFTQNALGEVNLLDQAALADLETAEGETHEASKPATNSSKVVEKATNSSRVVEKATNAEQLYALKGMLHEVDSAIRDVIG